jgi:hypothetical protein
MGLESLPVDSVLSRLREEIVGRPPVEVLAAIGSELREAIAGIEGPSASHCRYVLALMELATPLLQGAFREAKTRKKTRDELLMEPSIAEWPSLIDDWRRTFPTDASARKLARDLMKAYSTLCATEGDEKLLEEIVKILN